MEEMNWQPTDSNRSSITSSQSNRSGAKAAWKQLGMLVVAGAVGGALTLSGWLWLGDYEVVKKSDNLIADESTNQDGTNTAASDGDVEGAVQKVLPAVVAITSKQTVRSIFGGTYQQTSGGSGFIVRADGLIVTNKHVVSSDSATYTVTTNEGKTYSASVVDRDPSADLALIKISATNLPVVTLGDSSKLALGQKVVAIGNALGEFQNSVTTGIVSGLNRSIVASSGAGSSEKLDGLIQTDAAINPGNSGGPLVNLSGQVIGINTAVDTQAQSVGFAIPINSVKSQIQTVAAGGEIVRPRLGVRYIPLDADVAAQNDLAVSQGAWVVAGNNAVAVQSGSPASKAGIKEGDIIISVNNIKITEDKDLASILQQYQPGDKVTIKLLRDGANKTVTATLDKLS